MADFERRGMKARQGVVISGLTPLSTYQTQFWAPVSETVEFNNRKKYNFVGIPDGRICHLNDDGYVETGLPTDKKFVMPLLLQSEGMGYSTTSVTATFGQETPYISAIPGPSPNINLVPLCTGYEFLSTEYEPETTPGIVYLPNTPLTASKDNVNPAIGGVIKPQTEDNEIIIGFVARPPGEPRPNWNDITGRLESKFPNAHIAVTGKNHPGLCFGGCPLPAGSFGPQTPFTKFSVTAIPNALDATGLRLTFTEHPDAIPAWPLALGEITVTGPGSVNIPIKDLVTVVADSVYDISFVTAAPAAGKYQVTVTKANVITTPQNVTLTKSPAPPAPIGWMGIWYPNGGVLGSPTYSPLAATLIDLNAISEITGTKRNLLIPDTFLPDAADWVSTGAPGTHSAWDDYGFKIFVLTTTWGAPQIYDATGTFNQTASWSDESVTINGVTYTGKMSGNLGIGTSFLLKYT